MNRAPVSRSSAPPAFTLVVPTLNGEGQLGRLLKLVDSQTWRPTEIIVVDSESTDGTARLASERGALIVPVRRVDFDHGGTRNRAAHLAGTDVLVFTVQDAIPASDRWLEHLISPIVQDPKVGMTTGRQLPRTNASGLEEISRLLSYGATAFTRTKEDLLTLGIRAAFSTDANAAYRRSALASVGGFPEPCIVNEDMGVGIRLLQAGYALCYQPEAAIVHSHDFGFWDQLRRHFDVGVFFATSREVASAGKMGGTARHFALEQLRQVLARKSPRLLFSWCVDVLARLLGGALGRWYHLIPSPWRVRLSRHPAYWAHPRSLAGH